MRIKARKFVHYSLFVWLLLPACVLASDKLIIGYLETIRVAKKQFSLIAKIDSGADQSSIHAINPRRYQKHGEAWIKFKVLDNQGRYYTFDKKIVRDIYIKRKNQRSQKRPVIKLDLCVAGVYKTAEVNLANRSNFRQHMLIGRSFLQGHFLIDTSRQHLSTPGCLRAAYN